MFRHACSIGKKWKRLKGEKGEEKQKKPLGFTV
jgi:hypothetical protein